MFAIDDAMLETRFPDLDARQRTFVEMRATGVSLSVIARHLGVHRVTLSLWLKKPAVSTAIAELQDDEYQLKGGNTVLSELTTILMGIARNERSEDRDRIRACQVLLHQAADYYQRRFVARRMDKLEARILEALAPASAAVEAQVSKENLVEDAMEELEELSDLGLKGLPEFPDDELDA